MKIKKILVILSLLVFTMVISLSVVLGADADSDTEIAFPTRTIEIIIPWGAGGGTDAAARGFAQYIQKYAGQTVTIRNVTGGTGAICWYEGAQAHPDGYSLTLLTFDIIPVEVQELAPVSYKNFLPIGTFTRQPLILGVRADKPWYTLEDIVKAAKEAGPGVLTTGAAAITWAGITNALFQDMAGIEFTSTSYSGFGDQVRETLGGHIDIVFGTPGVFFTYPEDKLAPDQALRPIAITSSKRLPELPNVPTFLEEGFNIEMGSFRTVVAPLGTPPEIIKKLEEILYKAYNDPEFQAWANDAGLGSDLYYMNPQESRDYMNLMFEKYEPVIKDVMKKVLQ